MSYSVARGETIDRFNARAWPDKTHHGGLGAASPVGVEPRQSGTGRASTGLKLWFWSRSPRFDFKETVDCIRKFNARRKMKAAMTAVFAANQVNRKISCPQSQVLSDTWPRRFKTQFLNQSKSDTTCSDPDPSSVAKSSSEDESVIVKNASHRHEIEQVNTWAPFKPVRVTCTHIGFETGTWSRGKRRLWRVQKVQRRPNDDYCAWGAWGVDKGLFMFFAYQNY